MADTRKHNGRSIRKPYDAAQRRTPDRVEPHSESDPLKLLLAQLLATSRADMLKLRDKANQLISAKLLAVNALTTIDKRLGEFTELLQACQETAHWLYNSDNSEVPFESVCEELRRDSDAIREKTFDGLPKPLVQLIVSGQIPDWLTS